MKDDSTEQFGLVVSISVVENMNPIKTKVENHFFSDIEKGREFAKHHTTISKMKVKIA